RRARCLRRFDPWSPPVGATMRFFSARRIPWTGESETEKALGVALVEERALVFADRQLVGDLHFLGHELVRIVHRVEHAIDAEHLLREADRGRPLHAARRDPHVLPEIVARLVL